MDDLHDRFDDWLAAGAEGEPPRDLAVHASGCDACLRSLAAVDSLQAIDIGEAPLPPLGMLPPPGVRAGADAAVRGRCGRRRAPRGECRHRSPRAAPAGTARRRHRKPRRRRRECFPACHRLLPRLSLTPRNPRRPPVTAGSPSNRRASIPAVAVATPAPQVLPHSTPSPQPPGTPSRRRADAGTDADTNADVSTDRNTDRDATPDAIGLTEHRGSDANADRRANPDGVADAAMLRRPATTTATR